MKKEELQELTVRELKVLSNEKGLIGYSKLNKDGLIEVLRDPTVDEAFINQLSEDVEKFNYQTEHELLSLRKMGIGGSDVSVLLGVNKYRSPIDLYLDKANKRSDEEVAMEQERMNSNKYVQWGNKLENVVAEEFEFNHPEYIVKPLNVTMKKGRAIANIDRLLFHEEHGYGILEVKTANEFAKADWADDVVPQSYYAQVVHYLAVTGLKYGYLVVLIGGNEYKEFYIEPEQSEKENILQSIETWWEECIVNDVIPLPDGTDSYSDYQRDRLLRMEDPMDYTIDDEQDYSTQLEVAKNMQKEGKEAEQLLRQQIIEIMLGMNSEKLLMGRIKATTNKKGVVTMKIGKEKEGDDKDE